MSDIVDVYDQSVHPLPRRILVTGSRLLDIRRYDNPSAEIKQRCRDARQSFEGALGRAALNLGAPDHPVVVVHGAAWFGADDWARRWVIRMWSIDKVSRKTLRAEWHPADWDSHGKRAGMVRNGVMVDLMDPAEPHLVLACWDGSSAGTKNTIDRSLLRGLTVVRCWE